MPELRRALVEIVEGAASWEEVEQRILVENRMKFEPETIRVLKGNSSGFYVFVALEYSVAKPRDADESLHGTKVVKDGVTYVLHGIRHDDIDEKVLVGLFSGLELIVGEPEIGSYYSGENYVEQPRIDELKYVPKLNIYKKRLFQMKLSNLMYDVKSFINSLFKRKKEVDILSRRHTSAKDIEELRRRLRNPETFNLPEALEGDYLLTQLQRKGTASLDILRSLSQSEFLEKTAKERGVREAHWLGGVYHELYNAYFLRHPDFAERLMKEYGTLPVT